jgi:type VI secretion system protein ImpE
MLAAALTLRSGNPEEALAQLQEQVRKNPANSQYRTFLFQLLAVLGQWERALNQLKVVGDMDASTLAMVATYRDALHCEAYRGEVLAGRRTPLVLGEPEPWMALAFEALRLGGEGQWERAEEVRGQALEGAPTTSGKINGEPFDWIADADTRLGPMLEAVVSGKYYWIPFSRIRSLTVEQPTDLRDLVWTAAEVTFANDGQTIALIPTRYAGSEASPESRVKMARVTEWEEKPGGAFLGRGQRLFATNAGEYPILDTRTIELHT